MRIEQTPIFGPTYVNEVNIEFSTVKAIKQIHISNAKTIQDVHG